MNKFRCPGTTHRCDGSCNRVWCPIKLPTHILVIIALLILVGTPRIVLIMLLIGLLIWNK